MMLYVFHVDVGRMMNFDMTVALSSVENLKDTIERLHGITAANIVLLCSGGEMLTQSTQVSFYSAGTDTNPIYMFLTGETKLPPSSVPSADADIDLTTQVERALELPAVYETVVSRAQLALRMYDLARDEDRVCERLVHEQHLQQQGWSAVIANMEDLTDMFRLRFQNFCAAFDRHLERRGKYLELLRNFADDLTKLARIPILPGLMPLAEADFHGFDEFLETEDEVFSRSTTQQESVLVAGGTAVAGAATQPSSGSGTQDEAAVTDDKTSSTTLPNKKAKDSAGEEHRPATSSQTSNTSIASGVRRHSLNLLQWITSKENHNTLKLMSDECIQGLGTFNEEVYEKLRNDVNHVIKMAEMSDVKEIRGLGERLCKLEEFKYKIKAMVQDQKELSTAFQQNQNRAINLRDASILPDLCASHQSQMLVMLQNHQKIREHRRCISKAKDELGSNLHTRLKRIVWIENAMSEFDNRLLFYHRCLRRAERHINIIDQIHQAPCIYVAAVTEVVRRKIFSGEFRLWASKLAEDFDSIHNEEIKRREIFNASFTGHFLNILFPGMSDMPPAFANENPLIFDALLPNITKSDIDVLSSHLPDLAPHIQLPDMGPVINFFVSRSGTHQRERMEELLRQQVAAALNTAVAGAAENTPAVQHQRLSVLQKAEGVGGVCDESETDTETEFEKVPAASAADGAGVQTMATSTSENQPAETVARSTSTTTELLLMMSAATLTEENESSTRAEVERLRGILAAMSQLSTDCIRLARANLASLRSDAEIAREELQSELKTIKDKWNDLHDQYAKQEQQLKSASAERDHEMQQLTETLRARENELDALQQQSKASIEVLELNCASLKAEVAKLNDQLKAMQLEKTEAVAAARLDLIHEHKTEIESLRCRFKLMTSMEHSPSESSLEKLERPTSAGSDQNVIELNKLQHEAALTQLMQQHEAATTQLNQQRETALIQLTQQQEAALAQMRAQLDTEKAAAISAAVESERYFWQSKIFPLNSESVMANVSILKAMLEERERQLDQLREKDIINTKDLIETRTRLSTLTQEDGSSWLKEKIEYLTNDKTRLEQELTMEKSRRVEMETSVAALRSSTYEQQVALPRSRSSGSSHRYIVLESCAKGDVVFVVWSMRHAQFMVVQDSSSLYFVHGDSLAGLHLHLPPAPPNQADGTIVAEDLTVPMPYYAIGRVIEKEYCQARKDENRYRVTRGSKFYRIKVAPLTSKQSTRRERLESFSTSINHRSITQGDPHSEASSSSVASVSGSSLRQQHPQQQISAIALEAAVSDVVDTVTLPPLSIVASTITATPAALAPPDHAATSAAAAAGGGESAGAGLNVSTLMGGFKERTISFTTVSEEDDEPISLLSERCRYLSLSEEEEPPATSTTSAAATVAVVADIAAQMESTLTAATANIQLQQQQQSVITEQPTSSSKLKLDLLLASADITQQQQQKPQHDATTTTIETETIATTTTSSAATNISTLCTSPSAAPSTSTFTCPDSNTPPLPQPQSTDIAEVPPLVGPPATGVLLTPLSVSVVSSFTAAAIQRFIGQTENIEGSTCSPPIPASVGNASEDSDEYRSLEAKEEDDDADDFPISE